MATLAEKISAAEARRDDAASKGDEAAKAAAESALSALKDVQAEGFVPQSDANTGASQARDEGRQSGSKAERERQAKALDVEEKDLDAELERIAEERKSKQSEADQYKQQVDAVTTERDSEKEAREKAEARLRERDIKDSIASAAQAEGYKGNLDHLFRAADRSQVEEKDENGVKVFNAKPAIDALKNEEFPGFEKPDNPDDPPQPQRNPQGQTAADKFEERLSRRGRPAAS